MSIEKGKPFQIAAKITAYKAHFGSLSQVKGLDIIPRTCK
ncbi:MAG: hypothetical protein PWP60_859 [Candidatus Atribacteria bacterium]|nr:hypothetical protein [Candidatus Atribacteria bacterium]